ncbi:MAG: hypothetical protein LBL30_04375 [Holosporales bacterium]|jgi:hypothetical protein|nr:hypothetical protein [Holosporales bacterium]
MRGIVSFLKSLIILITLALAALAAIHLNLWGVKTWIFDTLKLNHSAKNTDNALIPPLAHDTPIPSNKAPMLSEVAKCHCPDTLPAQAGQAECVRDVRTVELFLGLKAQALSGRAFRAELQAFQDAISSEQKERLSKAMQFLNDHADQGITLLSSILAKFSSAFSNNSWYSTVTSKTATWLNGLVKVVQINGEPANLATTSRAKDNRALEILSHLKAQEIYAAACAAKDYLDSAPSLDENKKNWLQQIIDLRDVIGSLQLIELLL